MKTKSIWLYVLILLSLEKFVQHMVVTYAFYVDLTGIRDTVVVDHRILMVSGFIVGWLFLINIPFLYQGKRYAFILFSAWPSLTSSASLSPRVRWRLILLFLSSWQRSSYSSSSSKEKRCWTTRNEPQLNPRVDCFMALSLSSQRNLAGLKVLHLEILMAYQNMLSLLMLTCALVGCTSTPVDTKPISTPTAIKPEPISATSSPAATSTIPQISPTPKLAEYQFPDHIDPGKRYLFYVHGKIVEDQGIPAISPDYGEYEYEAILEKLGEYGFVVISEQRVENTDSVEYGRRVTEQVRTLLEAGVPGESITVVGASKGAGIAIYASHFLENEEINYVIMAICHPEVVEDLMAGQIVLFGNVLSIYDSVDEYAGSCQELFTFSEGKGITRYHEVVLNIGTGHGILYLPLDDWILPVVEWAKGITE